MAAETVTDHSTMRAAVRPRFRKTAYPYLWCAPIGLIMGGLLLYPWILSFILSLYSWTPLRPAPPRFVGLENYLRLLTDQQFLDSLRHTLVLVVSTVSLQFIVGFCLALMLNMVSRGRAVLMTAYLIPFMLTPSVVALDWKFFLHSEWGIFNWLLLSVGLPTVHWLADPAWIMAVVVMLDVWQHAPFTLLVVLAGLQAIPDEPIEAARVDGANDWQVFRHVMLPYLTPLIITVLLFRLIFAIRTFDTIYALFRSGGPGNAANVLGVYLYDQLQLTWRLGEAAATSYAILIITIMVASGVLVRWYRSVED